MTVPPGEPDLPEIDLFSRTWVEIVRFAQARIDQHRIRNERIGLPEREADAARGAIAELKYLLSLPELARVRAQIEAHPDRD